MNWPLQQDPRGWTLLSVEALARAPLLAPWLPKPKGRLPERFEPGTVLFCPEGTSC